MGKQRQHSFSETPIPYGWYAVAYSHELGEKAVKPVHFFGQDLVLFRTASGKAQLMEAFCPHLGAHLGHGGKVVGEGVACPFHAWELDTTGTVTKVPYAKNMPKRATEGPCLHAFPMQERNKMIWAWYHPNKIEPSFDIIDIREFTDPQWSELDTYEWEINTNLQETGENAVDVAHFVYVHSAMGMPTSKITMEGAIRKSEMVMVGPLIDDQGNLHPEKTEDIHLTTTNYGPGMSFQSFDRSFKTVMMAAMTPISSGKMILRFAFSRPNDLDEIKTMFTDAAVAEVVMQVGHDMPIWENKIYRPDPILCDGDGPIAKYRKWFQQFYVEHDDGDGASQPSLRVVG